MAQHNDIIRYHNSTKTALICIKEPLGQDLFQLRCRDLSAFVDVHMQEGLMKDSQPPTF